MKRPEWNLWHCAVKTRSGLLVEVEPLSGGGRHLHTLSFEQLDAVNTKILATKTMVNGGALEAHRMFINVNALHSNCVGSLWAGVNGFLPNIVHHNLHFPNVAGEVTRVEAKGDIEVERDVVGGRS